MTEVPPDRPEDLPTTRHSIVPRASVAGSALTLVVAIMSFLASLTLGAVSMVSDTARSWQSDIAREITVQVRPLGTPEQQEEAVQAARTIAGETEGIATVTVVGDRAMTSLLEPWLGAGLSLDDLPVPRLLRLTVNGTPDLTTLALRLAQEVPGASLDDHRSWQDRLTTMAQATVLIGAFVFVLMLAATVLTVVFATRGAMAGNREIIDVLHFVGAERGYIASQFQRHFLLLGL
ncbi:MAG: ABC transporter permease, partial [Pseudomonadota bacterium]